MVFRILVDEKANNVAAYEAGTAGDNNSFHIRVMFLFYFILISLM